MAERTIDTILSDFHRIISERQILPPSKWVEAGEMLNVLIGNENDKLAELEQSVAVLKLDFMARSKSVSEAKVRVEATPEMKALRIQKSRVDQIKEFIRLAKLHARIYSEELRP